MINVVLFEPRIPQNTGNIARTCAVTNSRLHLVGPMGFSISEKHLKRAGLDYWSSVSISYYPSISDFFEKNKGESFYFFSTKARKVYSDVSYPDDCFLIFGREDRGIDEEILLAHEEACVRLPMRDLESARSLNLSNTVAIAVYEALRQKSFDGMLTKGELHNLKWNKEL